MGRGGLCVSSGSDGFGGFRQVYVKCESDGSGVLGGSGGFRRVLGTDVG